MGLEAKMTGHTAEGMHTTAEGMHATAEGMHTTAEGMRTTAEGMHTTAEGMHTTAEGMHTTEMWMRQCSLCHRQSHSQNALQATCGQMGHASLICLCSTNEDATGSLSANVHVLAACWRVAAKQDGQDTGKVTMSLALAQLANLQQGGGAYSFCSKAGGMLMPHFCEAIWASLAY